MKTILLLLITVMGIPYDYLNKNQDSVIEAIIDIELKNHNGENLLGNKEYPIEKIIAKYSSDDTLKAKSDNNSNIILDNPNNIMFIDENKAQHIRVFLNHSASEKFPLTYIHWNKTESDTIKASYRRTQNTVILTKAWIFKNNSWKEIKTKPLTIIK